MTPLFFYQKRLYNRLEQHTLMLNDRGNVEHHKEVVYNDCNT